jgi:sugar phosphate isomerase/epimerase
MSVTIAFNMANLVAHYSDYRFKLSQWSAQHAMAVQRTGIQEWQEICEKIRACGYDAVEVWVALVEKCADDPDRAKAFRQTLISSNLTPVALAGTLNDKNARICQLLGIPCACGGYGDSSRETVVRLMRQTGILFNFENHPEKSVDAIRQQIQNGSDGLAVAVDTGWLLTQGIEAPAAIRSLGRLIRHVHLKDVAQAGGHETVKLGTGAVDIPGVVKELKAIGYQGVLSWEDEPEDRNPWEIAAEMRDYIHQQWGQA